MASLNITLEHNGTTYSGEVMKIKNTAFGWEDHGILTATLTCENGSTGQGVGGYCLDEFVDRESPRRGTVFGLDHVMRIMETVGVHKWEDLQGKEILVLRGGTDPWGSALGIADLNAKRVLIFKEHSAQFFPEKEEVSA